MNVEDFKARPVTAQTARPERRQAAFVREFGERIDLIHELRQLAPAKEIADHGGKRLRIDELLRHHRLDALIEQRHAFLDEAFGARQADAALVGEQFAHRADATAAQMVNVVHAALALFELEQIFRRRRQVFLGQDAGIVVLETKLLVDLVTAHAAQIITLRVKEQTLEQRPGVRRRRRISRTQTTVDVLERLFFVLGRIFLEALDDDAFVHGRVHDLDLGDAQLGDLLDDGLRQRFKRARDHEAFFLVRRVFDRNAACEIFELLGFLDRELFDIVKQLEDFLVGTTGLLAVVLALHVDGAFNIQERERAEERRRQKFAAAFFAVEINVEQVARVELRFIPRTAVRDDAEAMQHFAVRMLRGLERDARRAVQLADHDAFGAVDDERALRRHQGQFAHENLFFLAALAFFLEEERDIQRRAIGQAFAQTFEPVELRRTDLVGVVVEHAFAVVAFDGKDFAENGFETDMLAAFLGGNLGLQELRVGVRLQLDHVRGHYDLFDLAEVDTFCGSRWHLDVLCF